MVPPTVAKMKFAEAIGCRAEPYWIKAVQPRGAASGALCAKLFLRLAARRVRAGPGRGT
jgi:hypothetical protein